jgi:hypothetical protein
VNVTVVDFADIASVLINDAVDTGRTSTTSLSIVGTQAVDFTATKDYVTINWQTGYPEWTMDSTTQIGPNVTYTFSAPLNNTAIPLVLAPPDFYPVQVIGKGGSAAMSVSVIAYPSGSKSFVYDFGAFGDDVETKLKAIPVFGGTLNNTFQWPNGVVNYSHRWEELDNNPDVIWAFDASAGLMPLLGLEGKIRLVGVPSFITDILAVDAGIDLVLGGQLELTGNYSRDKNNLSGTGNVSITGAITGGLEAGAGAPGILILQITGATGITGEGSLTYKPSGNDVVINPSVTMGGLTIKIQFEAFSVIKWTDEWVPISPFPLYTGTDIVVIDGP